MQRQIVHLVSLCLYIPQHGQMANSKSTQAHSCHGIQHSRHHNIDEEFISTKILPKLHSDPKFTPKAIQNHLKEQYSVAITYSKAWRAWECALKVISGSHEEAYNSLPKYCQEIQCS